MSKFGSLSGSADEPFRVTLLDRKTDSPLTNKEGKEAYIDVVYSNSAAGRAADLEVSREVAASGIKITQEQFNWKKLARMTRGWHLVDPLTRTTIDVPMTVENAEEFYSTPLAHPHYVQTWLACHVAENFMQNSSKS